MVWPMELTKDACAQFLLADKQRQPRFRGPVLQYLAQKPQTVNPEPSIMAAY
ncbi:uncharacterized protein TrAFT101_009191 [Trichoderma asperellum]|uniref:uncharacterized protein n=1 Tax=Trichoderma asperellum TaxID=101201 RepID=UPI00332DEAC5|nr:hypothetical protein TrAFT101_009191 [Trichoderma asperellum]